MGVDVRGQIHVCMTSKHLGVFQRNFNSIPFGIELVPQRVEIVARLCLEKAALTMHVDASVHLKELLRKEFTDRFCTVMLGSLVVDPIAPGRVNSTWRQPKYYTANLCTDQVCPEDFDRSFSRLIIQRCQMFDLFSIIFACILTSLRLIA